MFDSGHYLNVLRLKGDLDKFNGYPLEEIKRISEKEALGCLIHEYIDFFDLFSAEKE